MKSALSIPGGVVETVHKDGGTVIVNPEDTVDVTARHDPAVLRHARPVN